MIAAAAAVAKVVAKAVAKVATAAATAAPAVPYQTQYYLEEIHSVAARQGPLAGHQPEGEGIECAAWTNTHTHRDTQT
jgi:hypothetical protein